MDGKNQTRIQNPFQLETLGNGRVKFSLIVNFRLLAALAVIALLLTGACFGLYWLGVGIVALAKFLWSIKWWLLGATLVALLIWALTKVNWRGSNRERQERKLTWLWWLLGILALLLMSALLFKGCERDEEEPTSAIVSSKAEEVTEERFKEPGDWIMLDAYLDGGFNVKYADYKRFESYGKMLSYEERLSAFDVEAYYADWGKLFPYFEGKRFTDNQLAALKRYGLWCGLAGFEASPACTKLQAGEKLTASDLALVYTRAGEARSYETSAAKERALKYSWVLMNVFDGNISIQELLDYPIKSYVAVSVDEMYDANGNYIFNQKIVEKLKQPNGNQTTRELLGL